MLRILTKMSNLEILKLSCLVLVFLYRFLQISGFSGRLTCVVLSATLLLAVYYVFNWGPAAHVSVTIICASDLNRPGFFGFIARN